MAAINAYEGLNNLGSMYLQGVELRQRKKQAEAALEQTKLENQRAADRMAWEQEKFGERQEIDKRNADTAEKNSLNSMWNNINDSIRQDNTTLDGMYKERALYSPGTPKYLEQEKRIGEQKQRISTLTNQSMQIGVKLGISPDVLKEYDDTHKEIMKAPSIVRGIAVSDVDPDEMVRQKRDEKIAASGGKIPPEVATLAAVVDVLGSKDPRVIAKIFSQGPKTEGTAAQTGAVGLGQQIAPQAEPAQQPAQPVQEPPPQEMLGSKVGAGLAVPITEEMIQREPAMREVQQRALPLMTATALFPQGVTPQVTGKYNEWREGGVINGVKTQGHAHGGVDYAVPEGTPIMSPNAAKVIAITPNKGGYGNTVILSNENGQRLLFAHMKDFGNIKVGDVIPRGTQIGTVGSTGASTGPHLHFEVSSYVKGGAKYNPEEYMAGKVRAEAPTAQMQAAAPAMAEKPMTEAPSEFDITASLWGLEGLDPIDKMPMVSNRLQWKQTLERMEAINKEGGSNLISDVEEERKNLDKLDTLYETMKNNAVDNKRLSAKDAADITDKNSRYNLDVAKFRLDEKKAAETKRSNQANEQIASEREDRLEKEAKAKGKLSKKQAGVEIEKGRSQAYKDYYAWMARSATKDDFNANDDLKNKYKTYSNYRKARAETWKNSEGSSNYVVIIDSKGNMVKKTGKSLFTKPPNPEKKTGSNNNTPREPVSSAPPHEDYTVVRPANGQGGRNY
jgi:murein DD-endopeptidase MepM/ murein hydrolase activator NlpD